jgi:hypothetical protein
MSNRELREIQRLATIVATAIALYFALRQVLHKR